MLIIKKKKKKEARQIVVSIYIQLKTRQNYSVRNQVTGNFWEIALGRNTRGLMGNGNVLFLDLCECHRGIFGLSPFNNLNTYDLTPFCTSI